MSTITIPTINTTDLDGNTEYTLYFNGYNIYETNNILLATYTLDNLNGLSNYVVTQDIFIKAFCDKKYTVNVYNVEDINGASPIETIYLAPGQLYTTPTSASWKVNVDTGTALVTYKLNGWTDGTTSIVSEMDYTPSGTDKIVDLTPSYVEDKTYDYYEVEIALSGTNYMTSYSVYFEKYISGTTLTTGTITELTNGQVIKVVSG